MRPEIQVLTDHNDDNPWEVYWRHETESQHKSWLCVRDIILFLDDHNIDYKVTAFQDSQTRMEIPDGEARAMIRLTFPMLVEQRRDDDMGGGYSSGGSIMI